jgi:hypothetical protein
MYKDATNRRREAVVTVSSVYIGGKMEAWIEVVGKLLM